jgi:hypothetical protein
LLDNDDYSDPVTPSHGENRGSIPLGSANDFSWLALQAGSQIKYRSNIQPCTAVDAQVIAAFREKG